MIRYFYTIIYEFPLFISVYIDLALKNYEQNKQYKKLKMKKKHLTSILLIACLLNSILALSQSIDPWIESTKIISQITIPEFRNENFNIIDYGAIGDGITDCTMSIKRAIEDCNRNGGGRVVIPKGEFFTGPIYIKSNVNLHLEKNATLLFSTDPRDYLPLVLTRWEGVDVMNYSCLISAFGEKNIAITGQGTLDGQAASSNWWPWKGRKVYGWKENTPNQTDKSNRPALFDMVEKDIPVLNRKFGEGHYLRPQFIQPYNCENILIEGVTILRSPMWVIHPVLCTNLTIKGVKVKSDGPNTDGCDPESCKNVLIKDCYFKTGDDCIALKSGRNRDGRRINIPCENVVIQNCTTVNGHAGIAIGSEISGGVKNVFIENCKISKPMWGIRLKTSSMRGGISKNIYIRNVEIDKVSNEAIILTMLYEDKGEYIPTIRDLYFGNIKIKNGGKCGIVMEAYPESPIENITFENVNIEEAETPIKLTNTKNIKHKKTTINGKSIK